MIRHAVVDATRWIPGRRRGVTGPHGKTQTANAGGTPRHMPRSPAKGDRANNIGRPEQATGKNHGWMVMPTVFEIVRIPLGAAPSTLTKAV